MIFQFIGKFIETGESGIILLWSNTQFSLQNMVDVTGTIGFFQALFESLLWIPFVLMAGWVVEAQ